MTDLQTEYALFRINGQGCAIPLETIKQVMPQPHCSVLPETPIWVAGLIEVLGQVVPLIDIGLWQNKSGTFSVHPTIVVMQPDNTLNRWLALRVDDVPVMCSQVDFATIESYKLPEPIATIAQQQVEYAGQHITVLAPLKLAEWSQSR